MMRRRSTPNFVGFPDAEPTINGLTIQELDALANLALEFISEEGVLAEFASYLKEADESERLDRSKLKSWWAQKKESARARRIREREEQATASKRAAILARKGARLLRQA